jgi:hypothetical protein
MEPGNNEEMAYKTRIRLKHRRTGKAKSRKRK